MFHSCHFTNFIRLDSMQRENAPQKNEFFNRFFNVKKSNVRAENNVGRFETSAKLTVIAAAKPKRAPRFTEELKDRR